MTITTLVASVWCVAVLSASAAAAAQPNAQRQSPAIRFQTVLGGSDQSQFTMPHGVAVDQRGFVYVTGATRSSDFPVTANAFQHTVTDSENAFVAKLTPTGDVVWATYFGGSAADVAVGIDVDQRGRVYIAGATYSVDLPTNSGDTCASADATTAARASADAFVAAFSADGAELLFSACLAGDADDLVSAIVVNARGQVFVGGDTSSTNFPVTRGRAAAVGQDGFVAVLSRGGHLEASRLIGATGRDVVTDIAALNNGTVYISGTTSSADFPVANAIRRNLAGGEDAFVAVLSARLNVQFSTFLGGSDNEGSPRIAIGHGGDAYVAGRTGSGDFPLRRALQPNRASAAELFVMRIDVRRANLVYSTYLGGSDAEDDVDIAVDHRGRAYLAVTSESADYPLVRPAASLQSGVFVTVIASTGNQIVYSTPVPPNPGQRNVFHSAGGIAVSNTGAAAVTGWAFDGFVVGLAD